MNVRRNLRMAGSLISIVYSPQNGSYNRKALRQAVLLAG